MFFAIVCAGVVVYYVSRSVIMCLADCNVQLALYRVFGKSISSLQGKVVFITGASSGIGEHIAICLAKNGAKLAIAARRYEELMRVKRVCIEKSNGKLIDQDVLVLTMDVLDFNSHQKNFDFALQHFGKIDILVNNAGRSQRAYWENIDIGVDRQMFDLNVFAVVHLSRIAVNYFNTVGSGHIAVTSSLAGLFGVPYSATYTASKHAIHGYCDSLRAEKLEKNIAVTILCPGPTFSNFLQESFTERVGEKFGATHQDTDRRMTGERCAELCGTALANKLNEVWMGLFPILPFTYIAVYHPLVYHLILKMVGPAKLFKMRDSQPFTEIRTI